MAQGFTKQSITYADGDVVGPASSTDLALARFDGTTGKLLQDSTVLVSDAGEMTNGSQPAFLAYLGTQANNVTGAGTQFMLGSGTALTEVFDQNSDFVTTGTFTAPVTGRYYFEFQARVGGAVASNSGGLLITTSNTNYNLIGNQNVVAVKGSAVGWIPQGSVFTDMDASDTCTFLISVSNESGDICDIINGANTTYVGGFLAC